MVNKTLTIIIFSRTWKLAKTVVKTRNIYIYIAYTTFHAPRNRGLIIIYYIVVVGGGGGGGPLEKCVFL